MGMKKAGLFSKSGCNWRVTPGSNPSSKQKRANPIYENETQFLREKSPQTLGITGKNIAEHYCSAMMCLHYKKDRGVHSPTVEENTKKRSLSLKLKLMVIDSTECTSSTFRSKD